MLRQYLLAKFVYLDLCNALHPCAFQSQVKPANASEQRNKFHLYASRTLSAAATCAGVSCPLLRSSSSASAAKDLRTFGKSLCLVTSARKASRFRFITTA